MCARFTQLCRVHNTNNDNNNTSQLLFVGCSENCVKLISGPVETALRDRVPDLNSSAAVHVDYIVSVRFCLIICSWLAILHYNNIVYYVQVGRVRWVTLLLLSVCYHCHVRHRVLHTIYYVQRNVQNCSAIIIYIIRIIRINGRLLVWVCVYCNIYSVITDAALVPVINCTLV